MEVNCNDRLFDETIASKSMSPNQEFQFDDSNRGKAKPVLSPSISCFRVDLVPALSAVSVAFGLEENERSKQKQTDNLYL